MTTYVPGDVPRKAQHSPLLLFVRNTFHWFIKQFSRRRRDQEKERNVPVANEEPELRSAIEDCDYEYLDFALHCETVADVTFELHHRYGLEAPNASRERSATLACEWLRAAASIRNVEIDPDVTGSTIYCGSAWDYSAARAEIHRRLITNVARFNFIWGAFENLIDVLVPGTKGRARRAAKFLEQNYVTIPVAVAYKRVVYDLCFDLLTTNSNVEIVDQFRTVAEDQLPGVGITVVNKIRNQFAHGFATLPLPNDWGRDATLNPSSIPQLRITERATRIVLHTIQMLLLGRMNNWNILYEYPIECELIYDVAKRDLATLIFTAHLEPKFEGEDDDWKDERQLYLPLVFEWNG